MMGTVDRIQISVNGDALEVPAGSSVSTLLDFLDVAADKVAVELNKSLVRKRDWPLTMVSEGAKLEVVEFVGGG